MSDIISTPGRAPSPAASTASVVSVPFLPTIDYKDGDVVLRSADGVDFHVHKLFLREASPLFRSMFTLPPPAGTSENEPIPMSENAPTLDTLLHWVYPTPVKPKITSIEEAATLLEVADNKLLFECAVEPLRAILESLVSAVPHPLSLWALTTRFGLVEARRAAFRRCLLAEDATLDVVVPELEGVTGMSLWKMRLARMSAIRTAKQVIHDWYPNMYPVYTAYIPCASPFLESSTSEATLEVCYRRSGWKFPTSTEDIEGRESLRSRLREELEAAEE